MIYNFCKRYLKMWLKKHKCKTMEIVISCDGDTLRKRDFKREADVKHAISLMDGKRG